MGGVGGVGVASPDTEHTEYGIMLKFPDVVSRTIFLPSRRSRH